MQPELRVSLVTSQYGLSAAAAILYSQQRATPVQDMRSLAGTLGHESSLSMTKRSVLQNGFVVHATLYHDGTAVKQMLLPQLVCHMPLISVCKCAFVFEQTDLHVHASKGTMLAALHTTLMCGMCELVK